MMCKDVFISYKSEEFKEADWVRSLLESEGISVWMASMSIPGGSNYAQVIPQAIRNCSVFVLILSKNAQESVWIPKELDQAINAGKEIMPFVIENCPLNDVFGFYLANIQCYEAFKDHAEVVTHMISEIKKKIPDKDFEVKAEQEKYISIEKWNKEEGMYLDCGCISDYMITEEETMEAVLEYPFVLIADKVISASWEISPILRRLEELKAKLLIIAEDYGEDALQTILNEKLSGRIEAAAIKAPSFGERRRQILEDITILTGGSLILEDVQMQNISMNELGCAACVKVRKGSCLLIGGMGDAQSVFDRTESIRRAMSKTHSSFDKEKMQERIQNLMQGIVGEEVNQITETKAVAMKYSSGTYIGAMKEGVPHGIGMMEYLNKEIYHGEWSEGRVQGTGRYLFLNGDVYEGEFADSTFCGKGKRTSADGSVYEGEWKDAKRHGHGTEHTSDGNIYNGEWADDVFIGGKAFVKYGDGSVYEGGWKDEKQNGQGIYYAKNGNIFEGEWKEHLFISGKCVLKYRDGRIYTGQFSKNEYNGKGTLKMPDGSGYEGEWVNGKPWGYGIYTYNDGSSCRGIFHDDVLWEGGGTVKYQNGDIYIGKIVNGQKHGEGQWIRHDGTQIIGSFEDDEPNGEDMTYVDSEGNQFECMCIHGKQIVFPRRK